MKKTVPYSLGWLYVLFISFVVDFAATAVERAGEGRTGMVVLYIILAVICIGAIIYMAWTSHTHPEVYTNSEHCWPDVYNAILAADTEAKKLNLFLAWRDTYNVSIERVKKKLNLPGMGSVRRVLEGPDDLEVTIQIR